MTTGVTMSETDSTTDGGDGVIIDVKIDPLDPIITVVDGAIPPATTFTAVGVTDKNVEVPITGDWKYDRLDLANIDLNAGSFTATGLAGGVGNVTFDAGGGLTAQTTATVKLKFTDEPDPVDPGIKMEFDNAVDDDPSLTLLYPYNKTVFPRGLKGPTVQWDGGNPDDLYYLHAVSDFFEYEGWRKVPPPSRFDWPVIPEDIWQKLTASTEGDVVFDIQRYDGNQAYVAETQTWTIAPANLTGAVYYWEVNNGNIVRLSIGNAQPENFIQKDGNTQCLACHSVSKDGSRIAAAAQGGWSPWTTIDPADGAVLYYSATASGFQAISPNGSHVLWGQSDGQGPLKLSTYDSNAVVAQLTMPGAYFVHPAWAGDTTHVAFAQRLNGNWLDFTQSHLWITDVDLDNNTFSNTKKIVDSAGDLTTVSFPTFSPDSKWIAYMRANQVRTRGATAEVWLTNLDGSTQVRLDNTNGVGMIEPGQDRTTYEPTFLPVSLGGYYWMIVGSERKYGNTLTNTAINSRPKQLWVTAINPNPQPGEDPSHPAFWLPGQELNNANMRGEVALGPCKDNGDSCNGGFECCGGYCYDPDMGDNPICNEGPGGECSGVGDACEIDAGCCDGLQCIGGFCAIIPG
jgi:Tol biopolymer transport system component